MQACIRNPHEARSSNRALKFTQLVRMARRGGWAKTPKRPLQARTDRRLLVVWLCSKAAFKPTSQELVNYDGLAEFDGLVSITTRTDFWGDRECPNRSVKASLRAQAGVIMPDR
jgi:hypothetical protein